MKISALAKRNKRLAAIFYVLLLVSGQVGAEYAEYKWNDAVCLWAGGCPYSYNIPAPAPGKIWYIRLQGNNRNPNDERVSYAGTKACTIVKLGDGFWRCDWKSDRSGTIHFWMPFTVKFNAVGIWMEQASPSERPWWYRK